MHVLIVDDDNLVRGAISRILVRRHSVSTADGGEEALALVQAGNIYDAIFCDFYMKGMNGDVFYSRLETHARPVCDRVIFITGGARSEADSQFLSTKRMLKKPIDSSALEAMLMSIVRHADVDDSV